MTGRRLMFGILLVGCGSWSAEVAADDKSGFHLWEVSVDGSGLRQVTFPPADESETSRKYHGYKDKPYHWIKYPEKYPVDFGVYGFWSDDMHPCDLPDGGIAFISTRCQYGILCDTQDVLATTVLYRIDADGGNMQKLTNSSVSVANPTVLEDGRILYTRWEYVDKGSVAIKCLWAMGVDGSASVEIYGNDILKPPSMIHGRQVPGHPNLFVFTGAPHCPQTGVGTIIRVDLNKDTRSAEAMTLMTPETETDTSGWYTHPWQMENEDGDPRYSKCLGPHFADPYPLDPETLIMVRHPDRDRMWKCPDGYGISLYEGPGRYQEMYRAEGTSCWTPIPLKARPLPPPSVSPLDSAIAEKRLAGVPLAICIVSDVYRGLEGVQRGEVKYIRINEQVPRPWAARRRWDYHAFHQQHSQVKPRDLLGPLIFENDPGFGNAEYLPPRSLGSTTARLVDLLHQGHYEVLLSESESVRLTTWIDSNAQYYGSYWGRKTLMHQDHPNFRPKVTFAQAISRVCPIPESER